MITTASPASEHADWAESDEALAKLVWDKMSPVARDLFNILSESPRKVHARELAEKLDLFVYEASSGDEIKVANRDLNAIREAILAPKFNYGAPRVAVTEMNTDGSLVLAHEHKSDGRGLDVNRAKRVLEYAKRVWRRPVRLHTVNDRGEPAELSA